MPILHTYNGTIVKKHLKIRKYGQKAINSNKTISFDNNYVNNNNKISLLCGHLER